MIVGLMLISEKRIAEMEKFEYEFSLDQLNGDTVDTLSDFIAELFAERTQLIAIASASKELTKPFICNHSEGQENCALCAYDKVYDDWRNDKGGEG